MAESPVVRNHNGVMMNDIVDMLKKHEGYRKFPYEDTEGHQTIGYGFKMDALNTKEIIIALLSYISDTTIDKFMRKCAPEARKIIEKMGVGKDLADMILRNKIHNIKEEMIDRYDWIVMLTSERRNVIIDMAYNMGFAGLNTFRKMIRAIRNCDWDKAADEMLDSKWAKQVGGRAKELAKIMREGR